MAGGHLLMACALLQGKYVVIFFYPLDFTFVCPTEITAFSDKHAEFEKLNAEVSGHRFNCLLACLHVCCLIPLS